MPPICIIWLYWYENVLALKRRLICLQKCLHVRFGLEDEGYVPNRYSHTLFNEKVHTFECRKALLGLKATHSCSTEPTGGSWEVGGASVTLFAHWLSRCSSEGSFIWLHLCSLYSFNLLYHLVTPQLQPPELCLSAEMPSQTSRLLPRPRR